MPLWTIIVVALGLAMDAVAVCIVAATAGYASNKRAVFRLVFHFGLFQFLMPVLGWLTPLLSPMRSPLRKATS